MLPRLTARHPLGILPRMARLDGGIYPAPVESPFVSVETRAAPYQLTRRRPSGQMSRPQVRRAGQIALGWVASLGMLAFMIGCLLPMLSAVHQPEEAAMTRYQTLLVFVAAISSAAVPANASFHTYDIVEVYSNADGTVQFIELLEVQGFNSQHLFRNRTISTNSNSLAFGSNLPSNQTAGTSVLIATAGFEELPGGVAADYTIPAGFFNTSASWRAFSTSSHSSLSSCWNVRLLIRYFSQSR